MFVRAEAPDLGGSLVGRRKGRLGFFDDRETSGTYTERLTHCPACGVRLEGKNLKSVTYQV